MKLLKISYFVLLFLGIFSCTSPKNYIYLQDKGGNTNNSTITKTYEYKIRPKDVLYIKIIPIDLTNAISLNMEQGSANVNFSTDMSAYLSSYNVNDSGIIKLPLIGELDVRGKTISECQNIIQEKVDIYLKDALIIVKLLNFEVTVLGEVNKPGTFQVYNTQLDVLDALGLAADLTMYGNRKNVLLVRQTLPGKIITLDLTDKNIINSDFYYLMPNDIIYVKPNRSKFFGTNPFPFATVLSAITTIVLLMNYIKIK